MAKTFVTVRYIVSPFQRARPYRDGTNREENRPINAPRARTDCPMTLQTFLMRRPRRTLALLAAAALLASGCIGLEQKERELTFRSTHAEATWYSGLPAGVQEIDLPVEARPDAPRIHAWWWPGRRCARPRRALSPRRALESHRQLEPDRQLHEFGFSVFAIDYRGFGKSDGDLPSEATVYEDARVGWALVVAHEPDPARRFIYGHSLGGAVAVDLAASLGDGAGRRARAHRRIVVHEFRRHRVGNHERTGFPSAMLSQKFDSVGKIARRPDAGARRAWAGRSLRAGALQRSAVRGGPGAEALAARAQRQPQQQPRRSAAPTIAAPARVLRSERSGCARRLAAQAVDGSMDARSTYGCSLRYGHIGAERGTSHAVRATAVFVNTRAPRGGRNVVEEQRGGS